MNIFVMRHGTTVWNEKGITQGRTNNRLSKAGIELTKKVREKFKDVDFDVIYCSPLMRTVQTANIMNAKGAKVVKDDRLIEIDQGIFTGRGKNDLTSEEKKLKFSRTGAGMESYQNTYSRTEKFLIDLKRTNFTNVLIITHNVNASFLEDILLKIDVDFSCDSHLRRFDNAEVKVFKI